MSYWNTSTGESLVGQTKYEAPTGGGDYHFADGTKLGVVIEEIKWASSPEMEDYINIRFSVMSPEKDAAGVKISNRKHFQKLWVNGNLKQAKGDDAKIKKNSDKAKRFFAAIANNVNMQSLLMLPSKPTDEQLAGLLMKPLTIRLGFVQGKTDDDWSGNYLTGIGPYQPAYDPVQQAVKKASSGYVDQASSGYVDHDGDSIPF